MIVHIASVAIRRANPSIKRPEKPLPNGEELLRFSESLWIRKAPMSFDSFDAILRPVVYSVLVLGFLSLLIGRAFIKRRHFPHAAETLWFVTLALLICFALIVYVQNRRLDNLQIQVEEIQEKLLHQND
jgi:hypothetical protein